MKNDKEFVFNVCDSEGVISFRFYQFKYFDAYAWWRFELKIHGKTTINFEMDTGEILLRKSNLSENEIINFTEAYRKILTPRSYEMDNGVCLKSFLRLFPNGKYRVKLMQVSEPYLATPDRIKQATYAENEYFYDFDDIRRTTTTPNILFQTMDLCRCIPNVIKSFENVIINKTEENWPLLPLFREPTRYHELHRRYHPDGYEATMKVPPHFGFNGNHIFFSNHNYYILDGHHKALAYVNVGMQPLAIEIECLRCNDEKYPQRPWWKLW
ncbi:MAG: hypothetical protein ACE5HI_10295 [bacterium]